MDVLKEIAIKELMDSPAGEWLGKAMEAVTTVQRHLIALSESDDSNQLTLLKIGTVFQIFLIDTLAGGKSLRDLKEEEWKKIAGKVSEYAILADGQRYSEFVFTLYADYIDLSAKALSAKLVSKENTAQVRAIADDIRHNTTLLQTGEISEVKYAENCLWLSLEAMIKCLSLALTPAIGPEFTKLVQATSQLAFEYGRCILYSKEQAILSAYVENQYALDEKLQKEYEAYLAEVQENADRFQALIDDAFSPTLHDSLVQSVELARAAGVKEEELLTSLDDIDDFFL